MIKGQKGAQLGHEGMNIAIVGCGYVAEFYAKTIRNYPLLRLIGAYDNNPENLRLFCEKWSLQLYRSISDLLSDTSIELVLNLTNPRSHYDITKLCLESGKHVYSEKPLAMTSEAGLELIELARAKSLALATAPCSLLSETAQTIWKAIKEGVVGRIHLVYANFDDGLIAPKERPWLWQNELGIPWPAKDEFEVGCTFEHAGYVLTWLAAFFGPARKVTAFASCQIPDKGISVQRMAPDFTVGCLEYDDGIVARVTCGLVAPRDKSLTLVGDEGIIYTENVRNDMSPVYIQRIPQIRGWQGIERRLNGLQKWLERKMSFAAWPTGGWGYRQKYPFATRPPGRFVGKEKPVDFCRGISEMANAIRERRACRLSPEMGWHIVEIIEALQYPEKFANSRRIESTFAPIEPLPWIN